MSSATSQAPAGARAGLSVRPVAMLVAICLVAGVLLGAVYQLTEPVIDANEERRAQDAYRMLVPEAASFEPRECAVEGCVATLRALDEAGNELAWIVVAESKGYGGQVPIAVCFDSAGTVRSALAFANDETPGLGTKIADEAYIGQYVGLAAEPLEASSIDLISGATISSKAALAAYNVAVEAYQEVRQ